MDHTLYACTRCGLELNYMAHLLTSSKLHSAPAGDQAKRPNCPGCTAPMRTMEEVVLEQDAIRRENQAKHEAALAELGGARRYSDFTADASEAEYQKRSAQLTEEKRLHPDRIPQIELEEKRLAILQEQRRGVTQQPYQMDHPEADRHHQAVQQEEQKHHEAEKAPPPPVPDAQPV
jgi:hypothetical protein